MGGQGWPKRAPFRASLRPAPAPHCQTGVLSTRSLTVDFTTTKTRPGAKHFGWCSCTAWLWPRLPFWFISWPSPPSAAPRTAANSSMTS